MKLAHLQELARLYDIQLTYEDASGKRRTASRDALTNVLRARIGDRDFRDALRERKAEAEARVVEPVNVIWGGERPQVAVRRDHGRTVEWHLELESGESRSGKVELAPAVTLGDPLPFGYHVLTIGDCETFLICAPEKAHAPQSNAWGILAPLHSIRTKRSWGAGDLGDLRAYREWLNELGGDVVATLPLLAIDADGDPSPYSPLSRLFWNEMYLEIERVPEYDARDCDAERIAALQKSDGVDYSGVMREKKRVLQKMMTRFKPDHDYETFAAKALHYAKFRGNAGYHLYVQYRMAQQMREARDLYLDFPLGVNPAGYDATHYASSFAKGVSAGAPPDLFFTKGQNWGFPPLEPDAIREQRYDYFRECIRHHMTHARVLRIDHVMGLHRLFWIAGGLEAKDGVYVRYRDEELYAILVLESVRNRCSLVGEDLGTVPQYVPAMMKKHGLRRMYVVQYEAKPEDPPFAIPAAESVASINTHDMPTFAGFWSGRDIDMRVEMSLLSDGDARKEREKRERMRASIRSFLTARGLLQDGQDDPKAVLAALLRFLAASDAEIVLVNLEDLWLETNPQNVPGLPERSWRQKFMLTLEEMQGDRDVIAPLRSISRQRRDVDGNAT